MQAEEIFALEIDLSDILVIGELLGLSELKRDLPR